VSTTVADRRPKQARKKRRLLVVAHTHPLISQGGAEIVAYEQFRRARDEGRIEAWFLASNGSSYDSKPGIAISQPFGEREYLHHGGTFEWFRLSNPDPAFEREFGALLQKLQPDTVHFHHYAGIGVEALLYVRQYLPTARIVVTLHEYLLICHHFGQMVTKPGYDLCYGASPQACHRCFPERQPQEFMLRELWLKRFLREVDEFTSPSEFLKTRYVDWGLPAEKIRVLPNLLPPHPPVVRAARAPGDKLRVAFFGQLTPLKGVEVLIRAARLLAGSSDRFTFRLYGSAASQPPEFQERMREALDELPDNMTYKGAYRNQDVLSLMAENDVVVVPSLWWENAPVVLVEAQRAGCIIVGSDVGGIREKLAGLPTGYTFSVGDADALVQRLTEIALVLQVG
jgi:glycosyltransferase involved in cell wall biosynthesis